MCSELQQIKEMATLDKLEWLGMLINGNLYE